MAKRLKTLDEHNKSRHLSAWLDAGPKRNGIACPICGKELWDTDPTMTLTNDPPQKTVHCDCGWTGYRLA